MAFAGYNRHMDVIESSELKVELSSFSAAVHSLYVKRPGRYVTLRLPDERLHMDDPSYSGNTIFPYAGRIKGAVWKGMKLDRNDGCNSLHGGFSAHKACFDLLEKSRFHALYHIHRNEGDDCLPCARDYFVRYEVKDSTLLIRHSMNAARPVLCDTTCHLYFNLDGSSTVGNHFIRLESDEMVVNDSEHCGKEIIKTGGTVFDLSDWKLLASVIHCDELSFSRGLNNAYLLKGGSSLQLSAGELMLSAVSDSPAVVLYSGGYLIHPFSFLAVEFQGIPINSMREERKGYERNMAFTFSFL